MEQRPGGVFLSPRNACSQGSIWNLNCGEMVFVINNQIFEPWNTFVPHPHASAPAAPRKWLHRALFWWWWIEKKAAMLPQNITLENESRRGSKSRSFEFIGLCKITSRVWWNISAATVDKRWNVHKQTTTTQRRRTEREKRSLLSLRGSVSA